MNFWRIASTFFFIGKFPIAPGSLASLITLLLWIFIPLNYFLQFSTLTILFFLGIISSKKIAIEMNQKDPSEIVIDEVVGMGITLFMLPHEIILYLIGFIIFRIFDIFKPSFIYTIQKFPHGWGIMLDDVISGIFAWLICQGINSIL
jgi:phosphatidylglycerophosphatase A